MALIINYKSAKTIVVGDQLCLYGDKYADPNYDTAIFEYEYATVENVEIEDCGRCILVETDNGCFGFPPDHKLKTEENHV